MTDKPAPDLVGDLRRSLCRCRDVEEFILSDTGGEFAGVCVECKRCGREFELRDVSETAPR